VIQWLPLIVFVAHMFEEYPRFPSWATRHFGATSTAWYVYSHLLLVAVMVVVCRAAEKASPQTWGRILGTALMMTLALNGVFHLVSTFLFREYSPGVVTGTLLFFPATAYLLIVTARESLLTTTQIGVAAVIGAAAQIAVIASLYLHMDIDWRFRRVTADKQGGSTAATGRMS
jgi:hypothetical protein